MAEVTIELCDGTPSLVEADLDYWLNAVGRFCPWSAELVSVDPAPSVGGITELPDVVGAPLETADPSGLSAGVLAGIIAGVVVVGGVALGGAAWYAARPRPSGRVVVKVLGE